jgi:acyl-CoA dehydrogenase
MFLLSQLRTSRALQRTLTRSQIKPFSAGGIGFDLTEDQTAFQNLARQFAKEEITPVAAKYDKSMAFPHEVFDKVIYCECLLSSSLLSCPIFQSS